MFHDASSSSSEEQVKPFNSIKAAAEARPKIRPADPEDPLYKAITASLSNTAAHQPKPSPPKRQSRYIGKLVETAAHRKEESARVSERRLLVKQTEEDQIFAGKERFVTSAYREKLKQDTLRDQQEALQEKVEEERRIKGLGAFYGNLFAGENVAIGGNVEQHGKEEANTERATTEQASTKLEKKNTRKRRRTRFGDASVDSVCTDKRVDGVPNPKPKPKKRGLRRNDAKSIEEYRRRYFERRAKRLGTKTNG